MSVEKYKQVVYQVFVDSPINKEGRKIQSLMYHVFDLGKLGLGFDQQNEDIIKCFKNEVSHIMRELMGSYLFDKKVKVTTNEEAANILVRLIEILNQKLSSLAGYIFGELSTKKEYFLRRVREIGDDLVFKLRQGELKVE